MKEELVRLPTTVAWKCGNNALLLTHDEFLNVSSVALKDFPPIDRHEHVLWVSRHMVFSRGEAERKRVHSAVCATLRRLYSEKLVTFCYAFRDDAARRFLPDFLLAYHTSRKSMAYEIEGLDDRADSSVSISFRGERSLIDRALRRLGPSEGNLKFMMSSVRKLYGSSVDFYLEVDGLGFVYHFSFDGPHVCDAEDLKSMTETYEREPIQSITDNSGTAPRRV